MTPKERRKLHYVESGRGWRPTFVFRPPVAYRYFCEAPRRFWRKNRLYHPVKPDTPFAMRFNLVYQAYIGHPWVKLRNRLIGRD